MNLLISFRSELLKTKRTSSWYLCAITAAITPLIAFLDYMFEETPDKMKGNPWTHFLPEGAELMNILILPMFIILLCTLLPQIEYRNNTWKQVLASPQPRSYTFISRYFTVLVLISLFLFAYTIYMLAIAVVIEWSDPRFKFHVYAIPWNELSISTARSFVCVLGMSAVQFWLGLRFRNFIVPIGIGLCLWFVAGMLMFETGLPRADIHPFTYPIFLLFKKYEPQMPVIMLSSVGYCVLFLVIGFIEFKFRKVKA